MVDFQSRDTSRGRDDEAEDENEGDGDDEHEDDADRDESPVEPGDGSEQPGDGVNAPSIESETGEREDTDPLDPDTSGQPSETDLHSTDDAGVNEADQIETQSEETGGHDQTVHDHEHGQEGSHSGAHAHAHEHGAVEQLGVAVVTVSSTRGRESDPSGDAIVETVEEADHEVVTREVVGDDLDGIQRSVLALTGRGDVDVVVTTGGTGVTPDDVTVEAITPLFDKSLPGFGELFRILSYEEVGTRALGSRATAGVSEGVPVFCLPGSENAVRLGMEELVVEEMPHLVGLATREA